MIKTDCKPINWLSNTKLQLQSHIDIPIMQGGKKLNRIRFCLDLDQRYMAWYIGQQIIATNNKQIINWLSGVWLTVYVLSGREGSPLFAFPLWIVIEMPSIYVIIQSTCQVVQVWVGKWVVRVLNNVLWGMDPFCILYGVEYLKLAIIIYRVDMKILPVFCRMRIVQ